jgi:hypothetical protein
MAVEMMGRLMVGVAATGYPCQSTQRLPVLASPFEQSGQINEPVELAAAWAADRVFSASRTEATLIKCSPTL